MAIPTYPNQELSTEQKLRLAMRGTQDGLRGRLAPQAVPQSVAPAADPAAAANPLARLNSALGLNIGAPYQNSATRQATDALPAGVQVAQGFADLGDQQKAAMVAQRISEAGLNLTPGLPGFDQQKRAAENIYNQIYGAQTGGSFMPAPVTGYAPTGLRDRAIAANGAEVEGSGGVMASTQGTNAAGGNRFMLSSGPTPPAGIPSRPAPVVAPTSPVQAGPTPLQAAQEQYKSAVEGIGQNDRYRRTGPMSTKDGQYLGEGVFDTRTGKSGLMSSDGKVGDLPPGAEPITATGLQKSIPDQKAFRALKGELTDAEISLRNMDRYIKSVGDANQGIQRLADKFTAGMKTLVGQGLNPQEIATKMAEGQLQGLLGANRTNVVGGGVMTEQDALRIIQRLGGDFNALSNPEIVRQAIGQVYSDRYRQYEDAYNFYNSAVGDYYGSRGFKPAEKVKFSENFSVTEQPAAPAGEATKPTTGAGLSPEKQKRLAELRAKAAAKNKEAK